MAAMRFVDGIRELALSLADMPHRGKPLKGFGPQGRTIIFRKRAIIVYRVLGATVDATRVFYAGRDYEAVLRGSGKPR